MAEAPAEAAARPGQPTAKALQAKRDACALATDTCEPDVVTLVLEQLALLSSLALHLVGGLAAASPPASVAGEPLLPPLAGLPPAAPPFDLRALARGVVQAHSRLVELALALPPARPDAQHQRVRIDQLRAEEAALSAALEEECGQAKGAVSQARSQLATATNALWGATSD